MIAMDDGPNRLSIDIPTVSVVILAAGRSSRTGERHKLLAQFDGIPLVRMVTLAASRSLSRSVYVVVGHRSTEIEAAIAGLQVTVLHNGRYASGMASSIVLGAEAVERDGADGILILLADMPQLTARELDCLVDKFRASQGKCIVRATALGKPGNPVIFPKSLIADLKSLSGDTGARAVLDNTELAVIDVEIGRGAALDVDTIESIHAAGGTPCA